MMRRPRFSIGTKITLLVVSTTAAALLLSTLAVTSYQLSAMRASLVRESSLMARIIAENGEAALAFGDDRFASRILDAVRSKESVVTAAILKLDGEPLAKYVRDPVETERIGPLDGYEDGFHFEPDALVVVQSVNTASGRLGTVVVHSDLSELQSFTTQWVAATSGIALASILAVTLLSLRLQRSLSRPIVQLADVATHVTDAHDFSVRAEKTGNDEIGSLVDAFNAMLAGIQESESALEASRSRAERAASEAQHSFDETLKLNRKLEEEIRERERAEQALAEYRSDLEELVRTRTRELARSQEKLRQSERLASVGTLAAGIAHQINNPVGSILNAAQFALMCEDEDDAQLLWRETLQRCVEEARRCGKIVHGVLQFSRNEPAERWVEDLGDVVARAARLAQDYGKARQGRIVVEECEPNLYVRFSPIELEQVMLNLIRNGLESTESGATIRVRTRSAGENAVVEIEDDGRGIGRDHLTHVFDPFFTTRLDYGGTGLGLSVAHGIVSSHGGSIEVESELGRGSLFRVILPLVTDPEELRPRRS